MFIEAVGHRRNLRNHRQPFSPFGRDSFGSVVGAGDLGRRSRQWCRRRRRDWQLGVLPRESPEIRGMPRGPPPLIPQRNPYLY